MLKIIDFEGNHLASIYQDPDGQLKLDVADESFRQEVEAFFEEVQTEPIYLVGGKRTTRGKQTITQTRRKLVHPGDPDFLRGVQDRIARSRTKFRDTRVRALLVSKPGA